MTKRKKDRRYRLTHTCIGYAKPRWCVWFCDDFLAHFGTKREAQAFIKEKVQS